jgi:COMM domain
MSTTSTASSSASNLEKVLKIGTLVDMDWKMGVGVVSSSCQRLDEPFVKVVLKVQDSSEVVNSHSFQLSLGEFKVGGRAPGSVASAALSLLFAFLVALALVSTGGAVVVRRTHRSSERERAATLPISHSLSCTVLISYCMQFPLCQPLPLCFPSSLVCLPPSLPVQHLCDTCVEFRREFQEYRPGHLVVVLNIGLLTHRHATTPRIPHTTSGGPTHSQLSIIFPNVIHCPYLDFGLIGSGARGPRHHPVLPPHTCLPSILSSEKRERGESSAN